MSDSSTAERSLGQTARDTLLQLADRCEREEPSEILDAAIARALGWTRELDEDDDRIVYWLDPNNHVWNRPDWSRSLDAAMTLVPDGLSWYVGKTRLSCMSNIYIPDSTTEVARADVPSPERPAMALCAASLRARAALSSEGEEERKDD